MKLFLLIAGSNYYPDRGTGDWKGCFETYDEAINQVEVNNSDAWSKYTIDNVSYEWYEIIDLSTYIGLP